MKLNLDNYVMEHEKNVKVHGTFINREISLLQFQERVLSCANDRKNPLNERFKYLAITDSNMDEFISVRFMRAFSDRENSMKMYKEVLKKLKSVKNYQLNCFSALQEELWNSKKMKFAKVSQLSDKEKDALQEEYLDNIFPLLTPISVGCVNEIPLLESGQLCVATTIMHNGIEDVIIIPIIKDIDLVYEVGKKIVLTEDIILAFMEDSLFINKEIVSKGVFRIIKDGSVILSHDSNKFIVDRMSDTIKERTNSNSIFLELTKDSPERLEVILSSIFKIPKDHIWHKSDMINYKRFMSPLLPDDESYKPFTPFDYENQENYYNLFEALKEDDILLHHPYDSYETVVKFIQHAAWDKSVVAIKQTLYRVSSDDSPIVNALCDAAMNGKNVTVLIEIKARFDEENNIRLVKKLRNAGVHVILGMEYLKTHCKLCIIIREEKGKLKIYSHVATGNYNEKTAKLYTDISYLTSKQKIGMDLLNIYNILSGYSSPDEKMQKIYYSPVTLRKNLIKCIDREIANVKKGKPGEIFMKINSMSDKIMAEKIYEAADKGVKVYMICRGVCSIVPRKNLYIKSIVGRFLEHSRIYYFKNGKSPEYYISSADLLTRNLDKRIETLISLKDSSVIEQLKWIIKVYKEDRKNSFEMTQEGKWRRMEGNFSCHDWFIQYSDIKKIKKSWDEDEETNNKERKGKDKEKKKEGETNKATDKERNKKDDGKVKEEKQKEVKKETKEKAKEKE